MGDFFISQGVNNADSPLREKLKCFLEMRLEKRLEAQKDENKRAVIIEKFRYENWFEYAAEKAHKLQATTHVAKFSHPSIKKASDIYSVPDSKGKENLVGTHLLGIDKFQHDLSAGNAADLDSDIKEFLRITHNGKTLFNLFLEKDETLEKAISDNVVKAEKIMRRFLSLTASRNPSRSHTLAKQIYWLVGSEPAKNDHFYLLSPLYATSLTQEVFSEISGSRFGDHAKDARKARRDGKEIVGGYSDYLYLAVQKMGGSNQQNVSQLNSERGGQNYLLASLPPNWESREIYAPMRDAFRAFKRRPAVWKIVDELKRFLEMDPAKNMHTRDLRDDLTAMLVDELMLFTFDVHSLAPGWTTDDKCQLAPEEQYWLDPRRADEDSEFAEARSQSDWHAAVSSRAAIWLNRELNYKSPLNVGDSEHHHWKRQFEGIVTEFRRQLDDLQDALRDEGDDPKGEAA